MLYSEFFEGTQPYESRVRQGLATLLTTFLEQPHLCGPAADLVRRVCLNLEDGLRWSMDRLDDHGT